MKAPRCWFQKFCGVPFRKFCGSSKEGARVMFAMIAMMMVGMATVGGSGCEAGDMLPLLKRHEIQILLSVGMPLALVAERVGVSVDTIERVRN
ncbi:MAG: helix-turn-helix domain-containing protein, partial [Deltaproteobacteria bacterium]